ncbi:MAG: hypothetical protein H6Q72_1142 [Firmicutes bacterium]|nr:hypothetical protein [Bacillota bacterium]
MQVQRKMMLVLTGLFIVILSAIVLGLMQEARPEDARNVTIKIVVWLVYFCFEVKWDIQLNNILRTSVMLVLISDSFWGLYWNLYNTSSIFDKVQHVFGNYAFSLFAYSVICQVSRPLIGRGFSFVFIVSLGLAIGALYEIGEFLGDTIMKPKMLSQPNLLDTDLDLIADMTGALMAAIHAKYISRKLYPGDEDLDKGD